MPVVASSRPRRLILVVELSRFAEEGGSRRVQGRGLLWRGFDDRRRWATPAAFAPGLGLPNGLSRALSRAGRTPPKRLSARGYAKLC